MILTGEKKLLPLAELKPVEVGNFPEVSVNALYKDFAERPTVAPYMPPKITKGKGLDKTFFFNVISTLHEEEL